MSSKTASQFKNGFFIWDEVNNGLLFVSREARERIHSLTISTPLPSIVSKPEPKTELRFRDTIDSLEQAKYRKFFQRRIKVTEPEIVTLQDVKDVAIFTSYPTDFSTEFISYFHTNAMDKFLRALVIYFQYYFQVWDKMQLRREEATRKLRQPIVTDLENIVRDNLADLRSMVGKSYAMTLLGIGDGKKFHHMNNQNNVSLSDKDRRLFECLLPMAVKVVWIALRRRYLALIEMELNRIMRTNIFSPVKHKEFHSIVFNTTPEENRVLLGKAFKVEPKLKHKSPIVQELVFDDHDYRMLALGVTDLAPISDERLEYLKGAYEAPEEFLRGLQISVGILGMPRCVFDAMLKPIERSPLKHRRSLKSVTDFLLEFDLPPHAVQSDLKLSVSLPKRPRQYVETEGAIQARNKQCNVWKRYILNVDKDLLADDLSLGISTKNSVLTWKDTEAT